MRPTVTSAPVKQPDDLGQGGSDVHTEVDKTAWNYSTFQNVKKRKEKEDIESNRTDFEKTTSQSESTFTMQEALDCIGFGPYQFMLSCLFGLAYMANSMEVMLLTVLTPMLRCSFHVKPAQLAMLIIVYFLLGVSSKNRSTALVLMGVYPTSIRAIGAGWQASCKSGGYVVAAIFTNVLLVYSSFIAISSFAAAGFLSCACIVLLPYETKDKKVLETLEEST